MTSRAPIDLSATAACPDLQAVFNVQEFVGRCLGNLGLADRLVLKFRDQLSERLDQLETAQGQADLTALKKIAHHLKGEAGNLSAGEIRSLASHIEAIAAIHDPQVHELLDDLRAAVDRFRDVAVAFSELGPCCTPVPRVRT